MLSASPSAPRRSAELTKRVEMLEEQYRLALAQRFAPKSEKRRDRAFNEAEQLAATEPADEDDELPELPDTRLPELRQPDASYRRRGKRAVAHRGQGYGAAC